MSVQTLAVLLTGWRGSLDHSAHGDNVLRLSEPEGIVQSLSSVLLSKSRDAWLRYLRVRRVGMVLW